MRATEIDTPNVRAHNLIWKKDVESIKGTGELEKVSQFQTNIQLTKRSVNSYKMAIAKVSFQLFFGQSKFCFRMTQFWTAWVVFRQVS